jgi:hypothetical protein
VNAERRMVALLDRAGRYHVALATAGTPPVSAYVRGFHPERGFGLLIDARTRLVHRILFEAIDCGQDKALELLHGCLQATSPMARNIAPEPPAVPSAVTRTMDPWDSLALERRADRAG